MAGDPFSPVAPVRLRALLLPIGKVKRSRFLEFTRRLQAQNVIRLGDVSPDAGANRNSFSPLAFPSGMIVYDLSGSLSPTSHLETFPFEAFREPLVILAVTDGTELSESSTTENAPPHRAPNGTAAGKHPRPEGLEELTQGLASLQHKYPRSLVRQLLVFDYKGVESPLTDSEGITWVPSPEMSRSTTVKTVMCDITAMVLKELGNFTESMEEWPTIESPSASSWGPRRMPTDVRPGDKLQHRMTMPAQLPSRPNGIPDQHSNEPSSDGGQESPTTFDEITRSIQLTTRAETLKSSSNASSKEHSRERKSIQGGGSVSTNERAKTRVKGRLKVVVGSLYLQAGLWPDAMRELVEGTTIARAGSDYIWNAKALETMLVCLLMLGWAGMDFQIPQICYPTAEKYVAKATGSGTESYTSGQVNSENCVASLQSLAKLLPDISAHIVNLYTRATNITDEPLPQLLFSETVVRLARLLSIAYVRDGILDDEGLKHIAMNRPLEPNRNANQSRGDMFLNKTDITSFLFRALPVYPQAEIPVTDSVPILAGMASVLSILGLDRKRGFILKEMLSVLIPGLIQARKIGAAEMGIHPAAGLLALNSTNFDVNALDIGPGNLAESMRTLLSVVGDIYGIQGTISQKAENTRAEGDDQPSVYDSVDAIAERTRQYTTLRAYGDLWLKIELLKSCINLSEALPDFHGVLLFTVDLLRTIKGTIMLSTATNQAAPALGYDEQVRLYNNVKRTVGAANMLGTPDLEAEYWDDFLVRGIALVSLSDPQVPIKRSKADAIEAAAENGPFIYKAFAKPAIARTESVLIAGEYAEFTITLQNPFDFEVEIESLHLEGEGVSFHAAVGGLLLAPLSLQEKIVPVLATSEGTLNIKGCVVKVRYCRGRRFPLFRKFWKPELGPKLKRMGLAAKEPLSDRPESWGSNAASAGTDLTTTGPEAETLTLNVIRQQPTLVIDSSSLSQSAIMLLEGETKSFDITLHNISSCPVDLVHFSFQDSTTRQLKSALQNKDALPGDIYELEWQLVTNPVLQCRGGDNGSVSIAPGAKSTFTIDVFGKPGLFDAEVQIDYGYVGVSETNLPENFYVRQIVMPLTVTVNASVEIVRCDLFPLSGDLAWANRRNLASGEEDKPLNGGSASEPESSSTPRSLSKLREEQVPDMLSCLGVDSVDNGHCLLLLDIRNNWPNPLSISVFLDEVWKSSLGSNNTHGHIPKSVREIVDEVQPGHISRVALVIPRIFIEYARRPIPSLNSGFKRQFVVSSHKLSYDAEVSTREVFWYREELLKHLRGSWQDNISRREGSIELRSIRLTDRMIDTLRVDEIDIKFSLEIMDPDEDGPKNGQETTVVQTGHSKYAVPTNSFLQLRTTIVNRSLRPIHPLLRLQPCLRNQPHAIALELSKRMAWTGILQRPLPTLGAGETFESTLGLTIFCRGEYEIGASVEEVKTLTPQVSGEAEQKVEAATGDKTKRTTVEVPDEFQETFQSSAHKQRRIWHARIPCTIFAQD